MQWEQLFLDDIAMVCGHKHAHWRFRIPNIGYHFRGGFNTIIRPEKRPYQKNLNDLKTLSNILLLFSICFGTFAQNEQADALFKKLKTNDSLLFNVGFNTCDLEQFENLISNDFAFYHDEAGITDSKAKFIQDIKNGICQLDYKPQRRLIENSLQVHPLKKGSQLYGAIQTGRHEFYAIQQDGTERLTSVAKFTHVWLLENDKWKLSRAFSYAHVEGKSNE